MTEPNVTLTLTKPEALALEKAADTGLRVIEALGLIKSLGLTHEALRKLREATRCCTESQRARGRRRSPRGGWDNQHPGGECYTGRGGKVSGRRELSHPLAPALPRPLVERRTPHHHEGERMNEPMLMLARAYAFAADRHVDQRRKGESGRALREPSRRGRRACDAGDRGR